MLIHKGQCSGVIFIPAALAVLRTSPSSIKKRQHIRDETKLNNNLIRAHFWKHLRLKIFGNIRLFDSIKVYTKKRIK